MIDKDILDGFINCSHLVQIENLSKEDFADIVDLNEPFARGQRFIDKALLFCGILRQCGFVMPPGYYGIDYLIPFVFYKNGDFDTPFFSFIAIQSKTTKENVSLCALKMAANLHLVRCPKHANIENCPDSCQAKFHVHELRGICENQICIMLSAKNTSKNADASVSVSSKNLDTTGLYPFSLSKYKSSMEKSLQESKEEKSSSIKKRRSPRVFSNNVACFDPHREIIISACEDKDDSIDNCTISKYPSILEDVADVKKPNFILTKVFDNDFEVQRMVWDYEIIEKVNPSETEEEFESIAGPSKPNPKRAKVEVEKIDKIVTKKQRVLTCIAAHSIETFSSVINSDTIAVILEIIAHETGNLQNVDPVHLPIVKNSLLNGKFCPYHACNPMLRKYRRMSELKNPVEGFEKVFADFWPESVKNCVIGPVNASVRPSPSNYYLKVKEKMEENEREPEPIDISFSEPEQRAHSDDDSDDSDDDDDSGDEKAYVR